MDGFKTEQSTYEYIKSVLGSGDRFGTFDWSEDKINAMAAEYKSHLILFRKYIGKASAIQEEYVNQRSATEKNHDDRIEQIKNDFEQNSDVKELAEKEALGKALRIIIKGEKGNIDAAVKFNNGVAPTPEEALKKLPDCDKRVQVLRESVNKLIDIREKDLVKNENDRVAAYASLDVEYNKKYEAAYEEMPSSFKDKMKEEILGDEIKSDIKGYEVADDRFSDITKFHSVYDKYTRDLNKFIERTDMVFNDVRKEFYQNHIEPFSKVTEFYYSESKKGKTPTPEAFNKYIDENLTQSQKDNLFRNYSDFRMDPEKCVQSLNSQSTFTNACRKYAQMSDAFNKINQNRLPAFDTMDMADKKRFAPAFEDDLATVSKRISPLENERNIVDVKNDVIGKSVNAVKSVSRTSQDLFNDMVKKYNGSINSLKGKNFESESFDSKSFSDALSALQKGTLDSAGMKKTASYISHGADLWMSANPPGITNRSLHEQLHNVKNLAFEMELNGMMSEYFERKDELFYDSLVNRDGDGILGLSTKQIEEKISNLNKSIESLDETRDTLLDQFIKDGQAENLDAFDILSDAVQEHRAMKSQKQIQLNSLQKEYDELSEEDKNGEKGETLKNDMNGLREGIEDLNQNIVQRTKGMENSLQSLNPQLLELFVNTEAKRETMLESKQRLEEANGKIKAPEFQIRKMLENKIKDIRDQFNKIPDSGKSEYYKNMYNSLVKAEIGLSRANTMADMKNVLDQAKGPVNTYVSKRDSLIKWSTTGAERINNAKEAKGMLDAFDRVYEAFNEKEKQAQEKGQKVKDAGTTYFPRNYRKVGSVKTIEYPMEKENADFGDLMKEQEAENNALKKEKALQASRLAKAVSEKTQTEKTRMTTKVQTEKKGPAPGISL